ncbi:hypothetical protein J7M22_11425 [Candidatus Poribacteria bacterium]|nr:hypothetical protein [Candidatus Poribacteria bacterium]
MRHPVYRDLRETGGDSAFTELVNRYWDVVQSFLTATILRNDWQEAEDVTQEAFCIAYRKLKDLNDPSAFLNYLRKIAYNIAKKRLKEKNGRGISYISFDEVDPNELAISSGEDDLLRREIERRSLRR